MSGECRLFNALWPTEDVARHLDEAVRELPHERVVEATEGVRGFRFIPSNRWHVTLCFHGPADQDNKRDRLDRAVRDFHEGDSPPRLRLASSGSFRGVLWVRVDSDEPNRPWLSSLAAATGADADTFHGHVTIARWAKGRPPQTVTQLLTGYEGPWWRPSEVALVRSEQRGGAREYETVHRSRLTPAAG